MARLGYCVSWHELRPSFAKHLAKPAVVASLKLSCRIVRTLNQSVKSAVPSGKQVDVAHSWLD